MNWYSALIFLSLLLSNALAKYIQGSSKPVPTLSTAPHLHWIFLQYHKTGHDFVLKFAQEIRKVCKTANYYEMEKRVNDMTSFYSKHNNRITSYDVYITVPGSYAADWKLSFHTPKHRYRILHMIRDPFELVLSAYLFHSQVPPPEPWIDNPKHNYCGDVMNGATENFFETVAVHFRRFVGNNTTEYPVEAWIRGAIDLCHQSRRMFHPDDSFHGILYHAKQLSTHSSHRHLLGKEDTPSAAHSTLIHRHQFPGFTPYHPSSKLPTMAKLVQQVPLVDLSLPMNVSEVKAYMSSLNFYEHNGTEMGPDLYPAIRIQALHALFASGDMLHMAVTKLFEDPEMVISMSLSDFPSNNSTKFLASANQLMNFLLDSTNKEVCSGVLCSCMSARQATEALVRACFVPPSIASKQPTTSAATPQSLSFKAFSTAQDSLAAHVTAGRLPERDVAVYKARLAADPILGPLLSFIARIIHAQPSSTGNRLIDMGLNRA